jgi:hypothetical protein
MAWQRRCILALQRPGHENAEYIRPGGVIEASGRKGVAVLHDEATCRDRDRMEVIRPEVKRYPDQVIGPVAAAWGLFGGFAVEGLDMYVALRRNRCWPWHVPNSPNPRDVPEAGPLGYVVAEIVRLLIGAGLAWAALSTGQVSGPLGAIGVGAAAPVIIGQLAKAIPLSNSEDRTNSPDGKLSTQDNVPDDRNSTNQAGE